MPPVVYLAHPVAPTAEQAAEIRLLVADATDEEVTTTLVARNLGSARSWLRWLVEHTDWAVCAPWMPYVEVLPDDGQIRERGLRDDCAMAARCDAIVLCGGRVSSGMQRELDAVVAAGGAVIDLTAVGAHPPDSPRAGLITASMRSALSHGARAWRAG